LRPLSYPQTDVFFVCFSVVSRASFKNVETKWVPEIEHHRPRNYENAKVFLVGTKNDLRGDARYTDKLVSTEEAVALAKRLNLAGYVETSALQLNTKGAFDAAVMSVIDLVPNSANNKKERCIVQ